MAELCIPYSNPNNPRTDLISVILFSVRAPQISLQFLLGETDTFCIGLISLISHDKLPFTELSNCNTMTLI